MSRQSRRLPSLGALLGLTFAFLALAASPALAARGHVLSQQTIGAKCTAEPCAPGKLKEPAGLALNEATGVLYVVDKGNDRVQLPHARTRERAKASGSRGHAALIQNPRSARRDHSLMVLARGSVEFDAAPVGVNAPSTTPRVSSAKRGGGSTQ